MSFGSVSSGASSPISPSSPSRDGLAMNWVFDHVLTYPSTYEFTLPLRTIYTLNSATPHTSPADFKMLLLEHISNIPAQPHTLPPNFLATFVRRTFAAELKNVEFDQALTALDYIRDLENRRKKELEKAVRARGENDRKIQGLRTKSIKIEQFYARAIAGIRRWTLIHELSLEPFNKFNSIAILNTLYPFEEPDINAFLTAPILANQRHTLWRYIIGVENNGPEILETVRSNAGGWPAVSESVHAYLRLSLDMIQGAEELGRPTSIGSFRSEASSVDVDVVPVNKLSKKSRKKSGFLRRNTIEDSDMEEGSGKASTLERIVRGLARLGSSQQLRSPKMYDSDSGPSDEDIKSRHDRY
ncbi:uncharacterized protein H6S33_012914 [Morchella sextelata]|uniref:uncharacterized protein n=1 Tax=Morchella sextelata TaxID=1174677 RepID=UPI001D04D285|nr:uncharacterized protein H6S33_012914 [Morchella sextelata]KAH0609428.1 hypothetical protein H6S33_012914 [Morchella sextelata]